MEPRDTRDIAIRALEAIERHTDDCVQYREAMDRRRTEDNVRSERMHEENQDKLEALRGAITAARASGGWTVAKYLLAALGTVITAFGVVLWYIITHGKA